MSVGPEPAVPDRRHNHLRDRLFVAHRAADDAVVAIGGEYGNPLRHAIAAVESAWTAEGSRVRTNFLADLEGVGSGVRSAFSSAAQHLYIEADHEPPLIDVDLHPELTWKTWPNAIDARARAPYRY